MSKRFEARVSFETEDDAHDLSDARSMLEDRLKPDEGEGQTVICVDCVSEVELESDE